jgi:hypothetical protein
MRLPTSVEPQREVEEGQRPLARRTADLERPVQGFHPVAEADQARVTGGISAAHAVVADREMQEIVPLLGGDAHHRRVCACLVALVSASKTA